MLEDSRTVPMSERDSFTQLQDGLKAKPISKVGGTSVITYFRKGKNCCAKATKREERENVRKIALQTSRPEEKEEEMLQGAEERICCSPWKKT